MSPFKGIGQQKFVMLCYILAAFLFSVNTKVNAKKKDPNVIFIIADDLNDAIHGMGGHPQAKTPNIDRLIDQGMQFTNAHANATLCGPSRSSLLTGTHPYTNKVLRNGQKLRKSTVINEATSLFQHFKNNGYEMYGTGKLFHCGEQEWESFDHSTQLGHDYGPWPAGWKGHSALPKPIGDRLFSGFGPLSQIPEGGWTKNGETPFKYNSETDRDLMVDEVSANWAADVLSQKHDKPFFLGIGISRPHTPFYVPKKYFDMFPIESIELPPYQENDLADCSKSLIKVGDFCGKQWAFGHREYEDVMKAGGEKLLKRWIQAYLACVAFVDEQIGEVLDALEDSEYAENTIIVFTSDHGYHMGEKDHLFKLTLWEESTRIPFVIVDPKRTSPKSECDAPVSLIDLYPTLIDLCNLPSHPNQINSAPDLQGYSLRKLLKNPKMSHKGGPVISSISDYPISEKVHFAIRDKRWRYIITAYGEEELYDHDNDPNEWKNLAFDPRFNSIKNRLKKQIEKAIG